MKFNDNIYIKKINRYPISTSMEIYTWNFTTRKYKCLIFKILVLC